MSEWYDVAGPVKSLSLDNRGEAYGDGLFETVAIRQGEPRLWQRHLERLGEGCRRLNLECPDRTTIGSLLNDTVEAAGIEKAVAKLVVTAKEGPRGYRRAGKQVDMRVGVFAARDLPAKFFTDGVSVKICETRIAEQPRLAGLKTLNRLEQVLGSDELGDEFEGLMLSTSGKLICGTMSNVFIVVDNQLLTPSLDQCGVAGVMRAEIIDLMSTGQVRVTDIDHQMIRDADEIFLCNSQYGVIPVSRCDEKSLTQKNIVTRIRSLLRENGIREGSD